MLAVEAAQDKILDQIDGTLPSEIVSLGASLGRVLADDLRAATDEPRVAMSAMDGYAVRVSDVGDAALPVVMECVAGKASAVALPPQAVARIFTGAPLPAGADAVIMQEEASRDGDQVRFVSRPRVGQHVRQIGEELRAGELVIARGTRLDAAAYGAVIAQGAPSIAVVRRPRVVVFSTGDELREPGEARAPHELFDSNRPTIAAWCRALGCDATELPAVGDDRARTVERLAEVADADLVISTGGVSVGDHDHVKSALDDAGFTTLFWKVAMKPGKPVVVARRAQQLYFGLPGNPVSAQVGFHLFVRPAIAKLLGRAPFGEMPKLSARLHEAITIKGDRRQFVRARVSVESSGELVVAPLLRQSSAALVTMIACNALIDIDPGRSLAAGELVTARLVGALGSP